MYLVNVSQFVAINNRKRERRQKAYGMSRQAGVKTMNQSKKATKSNSKVQNQKAKTILKTLEEHWKNARMLAHNGTGRTGNQIGEHTDLITEGREG